jgi:glutamate-1-semialdehyde aminotransferase
MGGTCVGLGHAYPSVVENVKATIERGVCFQRSSMLELELAERFIQLVPQHSMVKFCKNGSDATSAAVRLSRAYTGRKYVCFPGNHRFYSADDWFIGKSPCSRGIPDEIQALSLTYNSWDLSTLEKLFEQYPGQIACVISEPEKQLPEGENYLERAIAIAHAHGALFIADEMVTGFKTGVPGTIVNRKADADLATWGKCLGNGFSISALSGKGEIMELGGIRKKGAEKVFLLSYTHGGETTGLAAALATIDVYVKNDVIGHNHGLGRKLCQDLLRVIDQRGLSDNFQLIQCPWMSIVVPKNSGKATGADLRALLSQEMTRRGILFQGPFVPCFSHTSEDIDFFVETFKDCLSVFERAIETGTEHILESPAPELILRKFV